MGKETMKVLLVEDNPGDARLIREILKEARTVSFDVAHVDRLETGLRRLSTDGIDVLLLDLSLPDSQGLETLARAHQSGSRAAIIVLTGLDDEKVAVEAVRQGAQDYLVKGRIDDNVLVRAMRYAVERKLASEALTESERRYAELINQSPDAILTLDTQGRLLSFNLSAEQMSGYAVAEVLGKHYDETGLLAPESLPKAREEFAHTLSGKQGPPCELTLVRKDAARRVIEVNGQIVRSNGMVEGVQITCRDITARVEAEQALRESQKQLMQSEKMASIGQLAAGVAHEINNPVGFVMSNLGTLTGYVDTFKRLIGEYGKLADGAAGRDEAAVQGALARIRHIEVQKDLPYVMDDVDKLLEESAEGTERIRDIIRNLRSFARMDEGQIKEADINQGIEATLNICWNELKYKCNVHKKLGDLPRIRCYPGRLNQVFMNLLVNAAQAIEEHGVITIETEAVDSTVVIRISDTGRGIRPEHLSKIFDPFFTTKAVGKGTGLGLSISHGIVHNHNGTIEVESELKKGTTFTIRLPIEGLKDD